MRKKNNIIAYTDSEGPDQTARYAQSDLGLRCPLIHYLMLLKMDNEVLDHTVLLHM